MPSRPDREGRAMRYIDGFVSAVPIANRQAYLDHARLCAPILRDCGAARQVEGWGDQVPDGKTNDLKRAVLAAPDEAVLLSWIEYPDRAARDAASAAMMADPRMEQIGATAPFDGARMIYGGFAVVVDEGASDRPGYVDGYVVPVPAAKRDAYVELALQAAQVFRDHGASRVVEAWGDDVPHGKRTDFHRATIAQDDEVPVFSWIEWPSREARDAGVAAAMADPRMQTPPADQPFDGRRMIYGGFAVILDTQGA